MKWIVRTLRWISRIVDLPVLVIAAVVILVVAFFVWVDRRSKVRHPGECQIKTENGAILICHYYERGKYELVRIKRQRRSIAIPRTADGVHEITRLAMDNEKYYRKVKHIHLPISIEDINEKEMVGIYHKNAFLLFPNLKTITVEEGNAKFHAEGCMLYQGGAKLVAVAPGHIGNVFIKKEIVKIAASALVDLKKVTAFTVEEGNPKYQSVDGVLYSKNGKKLIRYPALKIGPKFIVPEGVKKILPEAFYGQRYLQRVEMPDSLHSIGNGGFAGSPRLRQVILNEELRVLGEEAFRSTRIRRLTLPQGLRKAEIGSIPAKELVLPEGLGEVSVFDPDEEGGYILADKLIIENPALDLFALENEEGKDSIFFCKKIYAYEGSLPYRQIDQVKDAYIIDLYPLPGKKFEEAPQHIGPADTSWYSKDKKEFDIFTPAQLAGLSLLVEEEGIELFDVAIHLKDDLDMIQYPNFLPISDMEGSFDGEGHTIYNLHIYRPTENFVGLFRTMYWGTIKNLHVQGEITGGNYTGGIVGGWGVHCGAKIKNCSFEGKVKGYGYSGKLYGHKF